jgi:hypothetical protein
MTECLSTVYVHRRTMKFAAREPEPRESDSRLGEKHNLIFDENSLHLNRNYL